MGVSALISGEACRTIRSDAAPNFRLVERHGALATLQDAVVQDLSVVFTRNPIYVVFVLQTFHLIPICVCVLVQQTTSPSLAIHPISRIPQSKIPLEDSQIIR